MVVSEAKYEELKSLYQAEVRKRLDREADLRHAEEALEKVNAEREVARREADYLRKRCQEAEERAVGFQTHLTTQEEVIERLKVQNSNFCEEQREAKKRADATAASLIKAKDEVARLVRLNDDFKYQLVAFKREAAAVTDQLRLSQADYDARGRVIKKLRKRLHKLKKKLKH